MIRRFKPARANQDIRTAFTNAGVTQYEVGEALNMTESVFSRYLRNELEESEKKEVFEAIDRIVKEREERAKRVKGV